MNETLAKSLGLSVALESADQEFGLFSEWWMVGDTRTGDWLGSWVPATWSVYIGGVGFFQVADPDEVLRLFAAKRKGSGSRSVAAAGPREVG